jgi:hypothetical protein
VCFKDIAETRLPSQVVKKPSAKEVHAIFLSAYYCNNVDSPRPKDGVEAAARISKLCHMNDYLLQWFGTLLQPDDSMLLVQWMLKTSFGLTLTIVLADTPFIRLKPPTWKLLDLLEANQAYINYTSVCALRGLLSSQPLSAREFLSALERFAHHQMLVQLLSSHPAASLLTSEEVLGALQHACSTGNIQHVLSLCYLPSAQALSAADLIPILAAAAAATNNEGAVQSLFALPAAQHMTPATASALLMSATSAANGSAAPKPCHHSSAQQLSVGEVAAVLWPACRTSQPPRSVGQFVCSLPAAQHLPPMEVAAALHTAIEDVYAGTSILKSAVSRLCELPGAKKMGASQVQGLLEAVTDCAAAVMQLEDNIPARLSLLWVRRQIMNLPAARQFWTESEKADELRNLSWMREREQILVRYGSSSQQARQRYGLPSMHLLAKRDAPTAGIGS